MGGDGERWEAQVRECQRGRRGRGMRWGGEREKLREKKRERTYKEEGRTI